MPINFEIDNEFEKAPVCIKVIGVGGGGGNAVNRMVNNSIQSVELMSVNTDRQALVRARTAQRIQIGDKLTKGTGAGGRPEIGQKSANRQTSESPNCARMWIR